MNKDSKIQVPNVLVITNTNQIASIINSFTSISSLIDELQKNKKLADFLFIGGTSNYRLLRLDHKFNIGETGIEGNRLRLTFIDPDGAFESDIFKVRYTDLTNLILTQNEQGSIDDSKEDIELKNNEKSEFQKRGFNVNTSGVNTTLSNFFWVSYGIGSEYDNWCPPALYSLNGASLEINEGVRHITLELIPNINSTLDSAVTIGVSQYPRVINANSRPIFEDFYPAIINKQDKIPTVDLHGVIKDVFKTYLSKVLQIPRSNVFIVLPNLNVLLSKFVNSELDALDKNGGKISPLSPLYTNSPLAAILSNLSQAYFNVFTKMGFEIAMPNVKPEHLPHNIVEFPGAGFVDVQAMRYLGALREFFNAPKLFKQDSPVVVPLLSDQDIQAHYPTLGARLNLYSTPNEGNFNYHTGGVEDYSYGKVIDRIQTGFQAVTNGQIRLSFHLQSDLKILNFWRTQFGIETDKAVAVFGDFNTINDFLYGGVNLFTSKNLNNPDIEKLIYKDPPNVTLEQRIFSMNYNYDIRSLFSRLNNRNKEKFGSTTIFYSFPDEFAFDDLGEFLDSDTRASIESKEIPLFTVGIKNSNVLDLKVDNNIFYYTALAITYQSSQNSSYAILNKINTNIYDTVKLNILRSEVEKYLANHTQVNKVSLQKLIKETSFDFGIEILEAHDLVNYLISHSNVIRKSKVIFETELDSRYGSNPLLTNLMMLRQAFESFTPVTVKTLPAFHLSNYGIILSKQAVLLISQPQFVGVKQKSIIPNTVLSGLYIIMGYNHIISDGEVSSEFYLVRNPRYFEGINDAT